MEKIDFVEYREIEAKEFKKDLLQNFIRHQEVFKCWRKVEGEWVLKDIIFVEDWTENDKYKITNELKHTVEHGGYVIGCFMKEGLIGYASIEVGLFGKQRQYVQMSELYVSKPYRGKGIGRALFQRICIIGKKVGAIKLYISAHSSEESQAFYRGIGCIDAQEVNRNLEEKEPCDCQMEYLLYKDIL